MDSDWYDIGGAQARKRASKSLGERDSKSTSTAKANPSVASASNLSIGRKRTRNDTETSTNFETQRVFLSPSLAGPLVGAIDSLQVNQTHRIPPKIRRRHSLELEGEGTTGSLVLQQEDQKILNNFGDLGEVDLDNIPTAAALASSVFQSSSEDTDNRNNTGQTDTSNGGAN